MNTTETTKKVVLIIMDGWGEGPKTGANAIEQANVPFVKSLYTKYPHAQLATSGEAVGLPEGQMGNSEVGHINIGAGRVVFQELVRINKAVREKTIDQNPALTEAFKYAKANNKNIHIMGLVSDGGVHSMTAHLTKLCDMAKESGLTNVFIHAFTDGRDTDPKSGLNYMNELEKYLEHSTGKIASVIGRYYAMDRDKRWERVKLAYDLLVNGLGKPITNIQAAIKEAYDEGLTDEFIKPLIVVDGKNQPLALIHKDDVVICFNYRTDRCREITEVLTQKDMPEQGMKTIDLHYVTMTRYNETFKNINVVFDKEDLTMTLGEVLANAGKKQIRIAETEKYPHVTFFFSGGREAEFVGERRLMAPSPKVATYDLQPEMSAEALKDLIVPELKKGEVDFVCMNFANPDMVGHTGVFKAVVKAVETVDTCVRQVVEAGLTQNYSFIIIADHGNAEYMINEDGSPNTAHTTNPVPVFLIDSTYKTIKNGKLADLAPTILKMMGLAIPKEMTGDILL
jgi:2,3-bisphosphoglycerate-independent phosphoglycerate mutase